MIIDALFSGYSGFILIRNITVLLMVILIILDILYFVKGNKIIAITIIVIAPLISLVINLWLINHLRNLITDIYGLAISYRANDNDEIISGLIFNNGLLKQEFFFSIVSFIALVISFIIIKKKSIVRNKALNQN